MRKIIFIAVFVLSVVFVFSVNAAETVASTGKTYTISNAPSLAYPDSDSFKLTDGYYSKPVATGGYNTADFVGFKADNVDAEGNYTVTIDLGEVANNMEVFSISHYTDTGSGIYSPSFFSVSVSDSADGEFVFVGEKTIENVITDEPQVLKASLNTNAVSGRYVRFTIHLRDKYVEEESIVSPSWFFLDEIEAVIAEEAPKTGDNGILVFLVAAILSMSAILGKKRKKVF